MMKYPVCEEHERWGGGGEGRRGKEKGRMERKEGEKEKGRGWRERKGRRRKEGEKEKGRGVERKERRRKEGKWRKWEERGCGRGKRECACVHVCKVGRCAWWRL